MLSFAFSDFFGLNHYTTQYSQDKTPDPDPQPGYWNCPFFLQSILLNISSINKPYLGSGCIRLFFQESF